VTRWNRGGRELGREHWVSFELRGWTQEREGGDLGAEGTRLASVTRNLLLDPFLSSPYRWPLLRQSCVPLWEERDRKMGGKREGKRRNKGEGVSKINGLCVRMGEGRGACILPEPLGMRGTAGASLIFSTSIGASFSSAQNSLHTCVSAKRKNSGKPWFCSVKPLPDLVCMTALVTMFCTIVKCERQNSWLVLARMKWLNVWKTLNSEAFVSALILRCLG
jgi:hypothetical protein